MPEPIDINGFIGAVFESSYGNIKNGCDGLTEEQLHYRPTQDSNPIVWLVWHLSRVKDQVTATISGEGEVWVTEGWNERFGMPADATGAGDSPEQVGALQVNSDLLFGYADAAHRVTLQRLAKITQEQLEQPMVYVLGDTRPTWQAIRGMLGDSYQHTGHITYLRGMITGKGWRAT